MAEPSIYMELVLHNHFTGNVRHFFPDRPDSCSPDAEVICSLSTDGSTMTVSINNASTGNCVVGYMLQLYHENMTTSVNESLFALPMDDFLGSVQLNLKVYTMDFEGQLGDVPCLFNITSKLFFCCKICC